VISWRSCRLRGAALVTAFVTICCSAPVLAAVPIAVVDAAGRHVTISDGSRIVSIGGAVTEILYALGLDERIVADDLTSTFPAGAARKPRIGYMRALSPEGVLSVNPSLVLAVEGSGPPEAVDVLEKAGVPFVLVPEAHDAESMARKIEFVADAVGEHERGVALADAVRADLATLAAETAAIAPRRRAVFVLAMAGGSPLVAGSGTAAADMFALAGVDNAVAGMSGYKQASDEAAIGEAPDDVVVMDSGGHGMSAASVFALPAFVGTPAARDGRLVTMDGAYLLGFGPRVAHAARDLAAAIYPERSIPPLPQRPWSKDTAPLP
jgi:iron complex transport system substrate-binding protein